ncbi:MAG: heme-binding protein [Betaproteobacteria bacterium]|nr:heme-binding protein [Betaproteobacteria bacterium]MDE2124772.1 heme-binding protein [Betaproteobacteria bacterium]MDE2185801.1 heme-binding protein [Betaproteobacteria bacterium]MDE2324544.1 heme-binding protein [Betaproteobacteria bacterium]
MTPPDYGPPLSLAEAKRIVEAAEALANLHGWPMVIAVLDSTSHLVILHKMDHAQYGSIELAEAKARTATHFKRPTKLFEDTIAQGGIGLRLLSAREFCLFEGGVPLLREGKLVGAIGVSGARSDQDGLVALAGASALQS